MDHSVAMQPWHTQGIRLVATGAEEPGTEQEQSASSSGRDARGVGFTAITNPKGASGMPSHLGLMGKKEMTALHG